MYSRRALSSAGKWGQSGVRKSECLFNCSSGVVGACVMHSHFDHSVCNIICFYHVIRPGSLILSFVHFSYAFMRVCFSSLK